MSNFTVTFHPADAPLSAADAARIYGMSVKELVRDILRNENGKYDRLFTPPSPAPASAE